MCNTRAILGQGWRTWAGRWTAAVLMLALIDGASFRDDHAGPAFGRGVMESESSVMESESSVEDALRSSRWLLDALLRQFPDGSINVFDRDLRYLYAAGAGHARLGLVPATLIGKRLDDLFPAGPVAEIRIHCGRAFAGEAVTFALLILERTYIIRAWPLEEADGAINAIVAMAIEVPTPPGDGHERGVWRPRVGDRVRIR